MSRAGRAGGPSPAPARPADGGWGSLRDRGACPYENCHHNHPELAEDAPMPEQDPPAPAETAVAMLRDITEAVITVTERLGAKWSPDFGAYASGQLDISQIRCLLCTRAPCDCEALGLTFGSDAWLARLDEIHGR